MKPSSFLLAVSLGISAVKSHAVDADGDGMDDIWQALHGIASFDGASDPDGDGRINLIEALNYSDPFSPDTGMGWVVITDVDPQDGMDDAWQMRHGITSSQALLDPDGDGRTNIEESIVGSHPFQSDNPWGERAAAPIPEGPGSYTVALEQTSPGMRYQLEWSDDLFTWQPAIGFTNPFWGTGSAYSRTLDTGNAPWMFFRFRMDNPDSDNDGLTDWAEGILGTDAQLADTDGDGFDDLDEIDAGTDPNDASSNPVLDALAVTKETGLVEHPVFFNQNGKNLFENFNDNYPWPGTWGSVYGWDSRGTVSSQEYEGNGPKWQSHWPNLDYPAALEHPGSWPIKVASAGMSEGSDTEGSNVIVSINHLQNYTGSDDAQPWDVTRKYLRVRSTRVGNAAPIHTTEGFSSYTIKKGQTVSEEFDLSEPPVVLDQVIELRHTPIVFHYAGSNRLRLDKTVWPPWLMIPQGETSTVSVLSPHNFNDHSTIFFLQTENGNVQPNLQAMLWNGSVYQSSSNRFDFTSTTTGDEGVAKISVGGPYEDEPVLRFAVYPRRTLKVTVHPITLLYPNGTLRSAPQQVPTAEYMEQRLDEILGKQANVFSEVTISAGAALNWDVGIGMQHQNFAGEGNGILDICYHVNGVKYSQEEQDIMTMTSDASAHVNVYWVATNPSGDYFPGIMFFDLLNPHRWVRRLSGALGFAGKSLFDDRIGTIWICEYPLTRQHPITGETQHNPDYMWTMAHEIVHYVGQTSHSHLPRKITNQPNPSYVPNSDAEIRLMTGLEGPRRALMPMTLVKGEWDALQRFFE